MEILKQLINLSNEIIECAEAESVRIHSGHPSQWNVNQLDVVRIEISEILSFALKGKVFFKYGKDQRMLESTYILTDSLSKITNTPLGRKIIELQELYNSI